MSTAPAPVSIFKSEVVALTSVGLLEGELEKRIAEDPGVLGLGKLLLVERQRAQTAGRLDLLLEDLERQSRFEVELMLGRLDESHLIRAIEYWDIERRRYPGYDHCAVVIAEDLTSRFLNVIQLFSGSVPIIAIQVNCLKVGDSLALNFLKVLDGRGALRTDDRDEAKGKATNREEWLKYIGQGILSIADDCLATINSVARRKRTLTYLQTFVGLKDGLKPNNFVHFYPRKSGIKILVRISPVEPWAKRLEGSNLDFTQDADQLIIDVTPQTFAENRNLIDEILRESVKQDEE
jgi:hypothetical protein